MDDPTQPLPVEAQAVPDQPWQKDPRNFEAATFTRPTPAAAAEPDLRHATTWSGDCPHWCKACAAAAAGVPTLANLDSAIAGLDYFLTNKDEKRFIEGARASLAEVRAMLASSPVAPVGAPTDALRELVEASDAYQAALPTRNWDLHDPIAANAERDRIDAASARKRAAWDRARALLSAYLAAPSGDVPTAAPLLEPSATNRPELPLEPT